MNQRFQRGRPNLPRLTPVIKNLMIAYALIQIAFLLATQRRAFGDDFAMACSEHLPLWPSDVFSSGKIWQVFTYMWIHDPQSLMHLAFNILVLYFFGPMFSRMWGARDFLRFYLICGLSGGILTVIMGAIAPETFGVNPVVGASAAIMGLIVAFGLKFPREEILLFFVIPVPGRAIIPLTLLIDLLMFASDSSIAITAHWGGMLAGYLLITGNWRPGRLQRKWRARAKRKDSKKRKSGLKVVDGGKGPWIH